MIEKVIKESGVLVSSSCNFFTGSTIIDANFVYTHVAYESGRKLLFGYFYGEGATKFGLKPVMDRIIEEESGLSAVLMSPCSNSVTVETRVHILKCMFNEALQKKLLQGISFNEVVANGVANSLRSNKNNFEAWKSLLFL